MNEWASAGHRLTLCLFDTLAPDMATESSNLPTKAPSESVCNGPLSRDVLETRHGLAGHIPALDGIRGLAVILVLFCHGTGRAFGETANEVFSGPIDRTILSLARVSFTGVDLFFVLSGFLITGILFDAKGKDHYFRNFYARRTVRIFPLYYAFLVLFLVIWPELPAWMSQGFGARPAPDAWYWLYHSNYAQSYYKDLGVSTEHVVHVSWSLAIEEQFYLAWPLVVFSFGRKTLLKITVGMFIGSIVCRTGLLLAGKPSWATGFTPCRLDGLAVGAAIALFARGRTGIAPLLRPALVIFPAATVAILILVFGMQKMGYRQGIGQSPGYVIIGATLFALLYGALLTLTAAAAKETLISHIFSHSILRTFGKYSYAIYLFHLPIMILIAEFVFRPDSLRVGPTLLPGLLIYHAMTWALTILASLLSWHLMEKHFLKLKDYFPTGG